MLPRLLALILCSLCFSTGSASSQSIDMPPTAMDAVELLSGRYKYVGNPDKDHAVIDKSIEAAISSLGWLGRKIARSRLANHKELPSRIEISRAGDNVAVKMGKFSAVAPSDGSERELIGPNGRDSKLHYQLEPETIVQFFVFEHAQRKSTYSFNDEGQLIMTVYMTSEKLASPIEYALAYEAE
jgi:hypothetical protein